MGTHKNSKAQILRDYIKNNPDATRKQMCEALGFSSDYVRTAIRQDKIRLKKHGMIRKPGRPPVKRNTNETPVGVKLNGGYYSLEKLKDIVKALELLSKISGMAKANND
jgi:hypothetical protein